MNIQFGTDIINIDDSYRISYDKSTNKYNLQQVTSYSMPKTIIEVSPDTFTNFMQANALIDIGGDIYRFELTALEDLVFTPKTVTLYQFTVKHNSNKAVINCFKHKYKDWLTYYTAIDSSAPAPIIDASDIGLYTPNGIILLNEGFAQAFNIFETAYANNVAQTKAAAYDADVAYMELLSARNTYI